MEPRQNNRPPEDIALNPNFRSSEGALLHALLQATDYGILMSGLDRQDIIANRRLGELFGGAPQEIVESEPGVAARTRVRDPEVFEEVLRRTYADPLLSYEDEIELVQPSCTLRRFTGPVFGADGASIGRLWTFLDITETKRLQAEVQAQLHARTEEYQATSDILHAVNALCQVAVEQKATEALLASIADRIRRLIGCECAAVLLLSANGAELEGVGYPASRPAKPVRVLRQHDRALAETVAKSHVDADAPLTLYTDYRSPIMRQLRCRTVGLAPLCDEGRAIGALAVGTRRPNLDLERNRAAHLGAVIDQVALTLKTHRLQAELHAAMESLKATQRRMVEIEKLRAAGTLAASVAHDIRNILTTLQMELAMQPEPVSEMICAQLDRFSTLTLRLLAFSRPSVLEMRPTSVKEVVQRIVSLVGGQAQISGVKIVQRWPRSVPLVSADASQLEHLFVNLCLNAIQAMAERGGTLSITGRLRQGWLEIQVVDTGRGIPLETIARVFDPFFTTRATGMGLGLFSCKRIVEEHGGQLTVTSAPDRGACFAVTLPVMPPPKETDHATSAAGR
jgi:signal transduction histidine kinase